MKERSGLRTVLAAIAVIAAYSAAFLAVRWIASTLGDDSVPPSTFEGALALATLFPVAATAAYCLVTFQDAKTFRPAWAPAAVVGATLLAISLAMPPLASADSAWNAFMGRIGPTYAANPYLSAPRDFPADRYSRRVSPTWTAQRMMYGPLWVFVSMSPSIAFHNDLEAQMLALRALNAAAYVGAGFLLYFTFKRKKGRGPAADVFLAAWLANPAALFEIANGGHNEGALVLTLAVAVVGLLEEDVEIAIYGLAAAALVKLWPLLLFPALSRLARSQPARAIKAACISAAAGLLLTLPFGGPIVVFGNARAVLEASSMFFFSPVRYIVFWLSMANGADFGSAYSASTAAAAVIFAAALAAAAHKTWTGKWSAFAGATLIAVAYFGAATPWLQPWHLIAFFPLLLFRPDLEQRTALLGWLLVSLLVFALYFVPAGYVAMFAGGAGFILTTAWLAWQGTKKIPLQRRLER